MMSQRSLVNRTDAPNMFGTMDHHMIKLHCRLLTVQVIIETIDILTLCIELNIWLYKCTYYATNFGYVATFVLI